MHNKLKTIASFILIAVMLFTIGVPVMAAEQYPAQEEAAVATETLENDVSLLAEAPVAEFHYTGRLSDGKVLGTVYVGKRCKTLTWTVGRTWGNSGNVRFKLVNQSTGASRQVTTAADNMLDSITYVSTLDPGTWEISVAWNSNNSILFGGAWIPSCIFNNKLKYRRYYEYRN